MCTGLAAPEPIAAAPGRGFTSWNTGLGKRGKRSLSRCLTCSGSVNPPATYCYTCSRVAIREALQALEVDAGRQVDWLGQ